MNRTLVRLSLCLLVVVSAITRAPAWADGHPVIEVFTTTDRPVSNAEHAALRDIPVTVYQVDGIAHFESTLSAYLPLDAEAAQTEALDRISRLGEADMTSVRQAAEGLVRALHYGVDRTPAIVLDGRAVIYGITDLVDALDRFEGWQGQP